MSRHRHPLDRRHLRGLSLIELMVSLTVGLVIVLATVSTYVGSSGASRMAEAQARMNEDAQAALTILTQQLRMAGNNPDQPNRIFTTRQNPVYVPSTLTTSLPPTAFSVRGCDGKFSNVTATATLDALACAGDANTLPDSIAINYEADQFNTIPTAANMPTDCLGNALNTATAVITTASGTGTTATTAVNYFVAANRFYIGTSTAVVSPSLYCRGNGTAGTAQPLVENIEDMQFTYGTVSSTIPVTTSTTATTVNTANIAGYLRADEILSEPTLAALPDDAERWNRVVSVRICLVVRSENPVVSDASSAQYLNCEGVMETNPPDLRLRRAYSTTVVLRNRR